MYDIFIHKYLIMMNVLYISIKIIFSLVCITEKVFICEILLLTEGSIGEILNEEKGKTNTKLLELFAKGLKFFPAISSISAPALSCVFYSNPTKALTKLTTSHLLLRQRTKSHYYNFPLNLGLFKSTFNLFSLL